MHRLVPRQSLQAEETRQHDGIQFARAGIHRAGAIRQTARRCEARTKILLQLRRLSVAGDSVLHGPIGLPGSRVSKPLQRSAGRKQVRAKQLFAYICDSYELLV